MDIETARASIGKQVYSCDLGDKMIRNGPEWHGPYLLERVTKAGMCVLSSGRAVAPSSIRLAPDAN